MWYAGDVLYFTPTSDSAEFLFNLGAAGLSESQVNALIQTWARAGDTSRLPESKMTQSLLDAVSGNTGNIQTNSNLVSALNRTVSSLTTEVDTLHPKIGRLVPITPWVRNNEARTLRFAWFPLAAVSTSDTLRMSIGGVAHTPRVTEGYAATDVSGIVLSVPVSASDAGSISRASNTIAGHVRVDLVMASANFHCYIPSELPAAAAPQSRILLAATLPCLLYTSPSPRDS